MSKVFCFLCNKFNVVGMYLECIGSRTRRRNKVLGRKRGRKSSFSLKKELERKMFIKWNKFCTSKDRVSKIRISRSFYVPSAIGYHHVNGFGLHHTALVVWSQSRFVLTPTDHLLSPPPKSYRPRGILIRRLQSIYTKNQEGRQKVIGLLFKIYSLHI